MRERRNEPAPSPYLQVAALRHELDAMRELLRECYQYIAADEVPAAGMKDFGERVRRALRITP